MTHGPPTDPLPYATPGLGRTPRRRMMKLSRRLKKLVVVASALGVTALVYGIVAPSLPRPGIDTRDRVACARNLRQIGAAVRTYARNNGGAFPDSLQRLITAKALTPDTLVCPARDDDAPAPAGTPASPSPTTGPVPYQYVGKELRRGLGPAALARAVVAFEPPRSHGGACHVLFGDGHVARLPAAAALRLIEELPAGQNPPTPSH
jgi:prepilin-type processing-associated H-X9-DG protein